ncbi:MAG: deoxynucleoside kinase [Candidatus Marinimicrobia bacterium]|nr:deoxynucleoside kinase [Candidatus Neomarinimicrobiota bacterium]
MSNGNYFIGIAGNIGVGKTTMTKKLARDLGWEPYFESVIDNPYLEDFYNDMKRWSFNLQVYFLSHRYKSHKKMTNLPKSTIQDRTIYEDVEIFARNLYKMDKMSQRDWNNYKELFGIMVDELQAPDLIIYLKASVDTLLTRIKQRSRDFERQVDPEYLYRLNISYDKWIKKEKQRNPVLVIDTNDFNIFNDRIEYKNIIDKIHEYCPEK